MENSTNSMMGCSQPADVSLTSNDVGTTDGHSFEESGWTMYFEDFFTDNNNNKEDDDDHERSLSFFYGGTSSVVSDAASLVVKKPAAEEDNDDDRRQVVGLPIDRSLKYSLSFKKRRTKGVLVDDALEDTASSPAKSPKVCDDSMMINQLKRNAKQKKDNMEVSQDKIRSGSSQIDKRTSDLGFVAGESDSTELRKRGLCLVPLSMAVNYLG